MGLLTSLITLPVSGPIKGVVWTAQRIAEVAEQEAQESSIEHDLAELERQRVFGEITEEEHARAEEALWERLEPQGENTDGR